MLKILWIGCDNIPNKKINPNIRLDLRTNLLIVSYLQYLNPYNKKIKLKKTGVKIPNSLKRNPDVYDPNVPKKLFVSTLDTTRQPVSSKLNVIDDKAIKKAKRKKKYTYKN